ncbi:hypothetical protein CEXT_205861 [Caerostris extrusa]|uniref:Uncharacterized protein n=1 Tax=Caerostris extrusa TaxID=172846 RepID=A0AAV4TST0_CAEEX|nr:hypothetical protein CEXT_205861 [Caerostris extrusa]
MGGLPFVMLLEWKEFSDMYILMFRLYHPLANPVLYSRHMKLNASSERIRMPRKDIKRRKSAMLWMRTYAEECVKRKNPHAQERQQTSQNSDASDERRTDGAGKKISLLKRHHSICVFEVAFSDEMAFTEAHLYPSHNSKKEFDSENHFNFPGISESPLRKGTELDLSSISFKIPLFFFSDGEQFPYQ